MCQVENKIVGSKHKNQKLQGQKCVCVYKKFKDQIKILSKLNEAEFLQTYMD